jgi:3-deoxy-manno-octulosonate cytidylyltransferase (CMP-KDO synthetase)
LAIVGIIPARYGSKRLPGKPLSDLHGKTLIERCTHGACAVRNLTVATDDVRLAAAGLFGGRDLLSSLRHPSAADGLAPFAVGLEDFEIVVNVPGGEALVDATPVSRAEPVRGEGMIVEPPEDLERVHELPSPGKGTLA